MLPRKNKISSELFKKVFKKTKRISAKEEGSSASLHFLKSKDEKKFSVVVPKKVTTSAVKRNLLKRSIYSLVEKKFLPKLGTGFFIIKIDSYGESKNSLLKVISSLLAKI